MNYRLYNDTLCPDLWDKKGESYKLKPDVRGHLLQITKDVNEEKLKDEGVKVKFEDVVIVGSSTNYNWTAYSDIDVHVLVDYSKMDLPEKEAIVMLNGIKSNWNKTHDIKIKGHDVELNFTDIDKKGSVSSVYSLKSNKWVEPPVKDKPTFNKELIKRKHAELKATIDKLMKDGEGKELDRVLEKLYFMRQAGLDRKGEMSEENIIFKILRAQGYVDKLKDKVVKLYDKEMTLKESLFDKPEDRYKPEDKAEYVAAVAKSKAMSAKLGKPYCDRVGDDSPPEDNHIDGEDTSMIGENYDNVSSKINSMVMYRGARDQNPKVLSGPAYFCSSESFAKTYGPTAAFKLSIKNPLVVSDKEWNDFASNPTNTTKNITQKLKKRGKDSVVNIRAIPDGKEFFVVFLIDPTEAMVVSPDAPMTEIAIEPMPNYAQYRFIIFKMAYIFNEYLKKNRHWPAKNYIKAIVRDISTNFNTGDDIVKRDLFEVMEFLQTHKTSGEDELSGQPSED
jgi:hypothetical protein